MKNIETERYDTNLHQDKARLEQGVRLKLYLKILSAKMKWLKI